MKKKNVTEKLLAVPLQQENKLKDKVILSHPSKRKVEIKIGKTI